jgi:hypothetical protein
VSVSLLLQMLWWGIDKTLAELFARHPLVDDFEGNPMDAFRGVIDGRAYGPNQTPRSVGLYGSGTRLSSAQVSSRERALRCDGEEMLIIAFVQVGADFSYCANFNDLLEVEWMGGDSEMTEKEYAEGCYHRDQLRPETGGQYFWSRLFGVGYLHGEG